MIVSGIDYSITSPAICIHTGETWSINNCRFHYFDKPSRQKIHNPYNSFSLWPYPYPDWKLPEERYYALTKWAVRSKLIESDLIGIEDYSFGSKGRVFNIAENLGLLKHYLWKYEVPFITVSPKEIKKYASGKGNAKKENMMEAFIEETNVNLVDTLGIKTKNVKPVDDIIDSYYIAKFTFHMEK